MNDTPKPRTPRQVAVTWRDQPIGGQISGALFVQGAPDRQRALFEYREYYDRAALERITAAVRRGIEAVIKQRPPALSVFVGPDRQLDVVIAVGSRPPTRHLESYRTLADARGELRTAVETELLWELDRPAAAALARRVVDRIDGMVR